jgi:putative nucleotidyltransferase with HDIG domain
MGILDSTTLFTACLLHDIGKVAMNVQIGLKNSEILQLVHQENLSFNDAEWKVVGGDHAVVGSEILRQWEFPFEIVCAVRNHHDPDLYIQDELSLWLSSCNIMTTLMGISFGIDTFMYKIHPDLPKKLGLTYDFLFDVLQDAVIEFEKTRDMLYL